MFCEKFSCSPSALGFNTEDPRVTRNMRVAMNIFNAALERKKAKKKGDWEKQNPEAKALLNWAKNAAVGISSPNEFQFQTLPKPRDQ